MRSLRLTTFLLTCSLVAAACGARLTEEQRALAVGGGASAADAIGADPDVGPGAVAGGTPAAVPTGTAGTGGGASGATTAGRSATGSGGGGAPGGSTGGTGSATTGGSGGGRPDDTRAAPPGGNGGATDVGVTETEIVVANVSDISGAVPGLFEDAQKAVAAYLAFFAATEGTVYGRSIRYLPLDSKLDSQENRRQYTRACEEAFAAVGSMSAFDDGVVAPVEECGIPDLRTAAVNRDAQVVENVFSTDAMRPGVLPTSEYMFWKEQHPEAVTKAGYVFINADTTQFQTAQVRAGTERIGYEWVYVQPVELTETNYAPFVIQMKREGVRFVTFQGAYQQAVRLAEAMRQQGFQPDVFALQSNVYTPDYIATGGAAVEGSQIAVPSVILEEIDRHPELQRYAQWLQQVDPEARPTGLGMYAWSSARLFVETLKAIGPELTRQAVVRHLAGVHAFDGGGLIPPQDIGSKEPADCVIVVEVQGGGFVRVEPRSQAMRCDNRVVDAT